MGAKRANVVRLAVTWESLAEDLLLECEALMTPRGAQFYRERLKVFLPWAASQGLAPETFRGHDLTRYIHTRRQTVSAATAIHDAKAVRKLFRFAAANGNLPANPLKDYSVGSPPDAAVFMPTDEDVRRLLAAVEDAWRPTTNPACRFRCQRERTFYLRSHRAIIAGLAATGCRVNELLALKQADYDADARQLRVVGGKGGKNRTVLFSASWARLVSDWLKVRPRFAGDEGYLFINQHGGRITYRPFLCAFSRYCKAAGVPDLTPHGLRHYALTNLAKTDLLMAQAQAGHENIATTNRYLHMDGAHNRAKYDEAAPLDRILVNRRSEQQKQRRVIGG